MTISEKITNLRKEKNLSQEAFAEKCGLHRTYISAVECYRRSISLENIQRIADALGIAMIIKSASVMSA